MCGSSSMTQDGLLRLHPAAYPQRSRCQRSSARPLQPRTARALRERAASTETAARQASPSSPRYVAERSAEAGDEERSRPWRHVRRRRSAGGAAAWPGTWRRSARCLRVRSLGAARRRSSSRRCRSASPLGFWQASSSPPVNCWISQRQKLVQASARAPPHWPVCVEARRARRGSDLVASVTSVATRQRAVARAAVAAERASITAQGTWPIELRGRSTVAVRAWTIELARQALAARALPSGAR